MTQVQTKIRKVRLERGLSMDQVSAATGIHKAILQRVETGSRIVQKEHARQLYAYYDYEIDLADIYDPTFDTEVAGAEPLEVDSG